MRVRLILSLVMIGLMGGFLMGGDTTTKEPTKFKGTLPKDWKKLGLTEDQIQSVYKIQSKYVAQIDQLKAKIKELQKDEKGELEKLLTPAQKDRLRELIIGNVKPAPEKDKKDK